MQASDVGHSSSCWHSPVLTSKEKGRFKVKVFETYQWQISVWLTLDTTPEWISSKSRWASTIGLVVVHKTGCIWTAGVIVYTWVLTVSIVASFIAGTFVIRWATNRLRNNCGMGWNKLIQSIAFTHKIPCCYSRIFSQRSSPLPVKPGTQVQDIVLKGRVLWTVHSALVAHGDMASQGFLHFSCKQASLLGQSLSVVHSTFGIGTVGGEWKVGYKRALLNDKKYDWWALLLLQTEPYGFPV